MTRPVNSSLWGDSSRRDSSHGAIINLATSRTATVVPMTDCYSPTKAAIANLTKVAVVHCGASGYDIRVNSVPGRSSVAT